MTSQSKKNEFKKTSKKVFAPPVVKSYCVPFGKGELELHGKQEHGVTVKSINISPTQSKRQKKNISNAEKKSQSKKNLEMIKNENRSLTDAQFEEIVQSVLQKSLQECMEKFKEKVVSAESTEGQHSRRETVEALLAAEGNDLGKKTETRLPEVERKEHQFKMKQSKSCAHKGEQKINEKAEANNGGCKENRKGEPKKTIRGNTQDVTDQEEMQEEEAGGGSGGSSWYTAWVQCSYPNCEKWRKLSSDVDPSVLPEDWSCSQNPDLQYNSCSVPEETWSGSENEVVYAIYFPGSIVWAKQYGYAWWPGIIEADPDTEEYFLFSSQSDSLPCKYHVTFFGNSVTRAWISASLLKNFGEPPGEGNALAKLRSKGEKENFKAAVEMAKEAEQIGIQERIRRFGFYSRFKDKESPKDHKTLKDRNNVTSRPWAKRTQETRGGKKNTATSSKSQEKILHEISAVKPKADIKKTLNVKGDKKPKLATENASPVSKKSRQERPALTASATLQGSDQATEKQRSRKGFKQSFSAPQRRTTPARHLHSCPDHSTAHLAFPSYPGKKDNLNKPEGSPGAQRKRMPRKGAVGEPKETLGLERGEEEALSSSEMALSAEEEEEEEEENSSEDFCLTFFEE